MRVFEQNLANWIISFLQHLHRVHAETTVGQKSCLWTNKYFAHATRLGCIRSSLREIIQQQQQQQQYVVQKRWGNEKNIQHAVVVYIIVQDRMRSHLAWWWFRILFFLWSNVVFLKRLGATAARQVRSDTTAQPIRISRYLPSSDINRFYTARIATRRFQINSPPPPSKFVKFYYDIRMFLVWRFSNFRTHAFYIMKT